jgi:LysM repeat protein
MKTTLLLLSSTATLFVASCGQQSGQDAYDVSNPYAAADYANEDGSPYEANPAYDAPAAYEEESSDAAVSVTPTSEPRIHTVVRGDTLWGLSKQYGVSVSSIKRENSMVNDIVVLGANLKIPGQ